MKINELWGIGEAAPEYRAAKSKIKTKDRGNWAGESNNGDGGGIEGESKITNNYSRLCFRRIPFWLWMVKISENVCWSECLIAIVKLSVRWIFGRCWRKDEKELLKFWR